MQFTKAEFEQLCVVTCPFCLRGHRATQRAATGEWVHDGVTAVAPGRDMISHTLCRADGLRRSTFADLATED